MDNGADVPVSQPPAKLAIFAAQKEFEARNAYGLKFAEEKSHALEILRGNEYTLKVGNENPKSLERAMANVALIGLTLNPKFKFAYLLPRDGKVILEISYMGLIKIAEDAGAVVRADASLVYANDKFEFRGPFEAPAHRCNPARPEQRGEFAGVYCLAELPGNRMSCVWVPANEVEMARDQSKAWQKNKSGAWVWFEPMTRKVAIKRAFNVWPKHNLREDGMSRMTNAIDILNQENGEGLSRLTDGSGDVDPDSIPVPPEEMVDEDIRASVEELVKFAKKKNAKKAALAKANEMFFGSDLAYARDRLNKVVPAHVNA